MPARVRRNPTDDWEQLRLLMGSPEQEAGEIPRPAVLFGQPTAERTHETGTAERTPRRAVARFETAGMRSRFDPDPPPPHADRRRWPAARGPRPARKVDLTTMAAVRRLQAKRGPPPRCPGATWH